MIGRSAECTGLRACVGAIFCIWSLIRKFLKVKLQPEMGRGLGGSVTVCALCREPYLCDIPTFSWPHILIHTGVAADALERSTLGMTWGTRSAQADQVQREVRRIRL